MIARYELPTAGDLGLGDVQLVRDPSDFEVSPDIIGQSDDELRARAEAGEWHLYDTHGIDSETLSLSALRARFDDTFRARGGDRMDEPGAFIGAIWNAQRVLPNVSEFAAYLARKGLLRPEESAQAAIAVAGSTSRYGAPDTDEKYELDRTEWKLRYLANVPPSVAVSGTGLAKRAAEYADNMSQSERKPAARIKAYDLLLRARGLDESEIDRSIDAIRNRKPIGEAISKFRFAGLPPELAERLDAIRRPNPLGRDPYEAAQGLASRLLEESIEGQIVSRQCFGAENLVDLLETQLELERAIQDQRLSFSSHLIYNSLAGSRMLQIDTDAPHGPESDFTAANTSEMLLMEPQKLQRLGDLAAFAVHEKPLRDVLSLHTLGMVQAAYRIAVERMVAGV